MPTPTLAAGAYASARNLLASGTSGSAGLASSVGAGGGDGGFGAMLKNALEGVAQSGRAAETQATAAAAGKTDLVNVVTAVAESETALQTLVAVRDRVISAYEEIMRMQI